MKAMRLLGVSLLLATSARGDQDLLQDGASFEVGYDGFSLNNQYLFSHRGREIEPVFDDTDAVHGKYSLRIDNPLLDMYDEKFHEAIKYVNMTNNLVNMIDYQTSYAFWQKLSDEEKAVFKKAIEEASVITRKEVDKRLEAVKKELQEKGIEFIQTDTSGFRQAIKDNIDTILEGNQDAIKMYHTIVNKEY